MHGRYLETGACGTRESEAVGGAGGDRKLGHMREILRP
jgi:hypothetical protein